MVWILGKIIPFGEFFDEFLKIKMYFLNLRPRILMGNILVGFFSKDYDFTRQIKNIYDMI